MPPAPPSVPGIEHVDVELATGLRAHVALAGPRDAPPVLAVHGWPQHWWCWRHVTARLRDAIRIACPDLRGFGWSGWPADGSFSTERFADDILATLDALGWERALLVGHDWGGVAGYRVAFGAPERLCGLLALGAPHPWQPAARVASHAWRFAYQLPLAAPRAGAALVRDGRLVERLLRGAAGNPGVFDAAAVEVYRSVLREGRAAEASERLYRSFLLGGAAALGRRADGRRLRVPVRLVLGRSDPLGSALAGGLDEHGDDARAEVVDGCGHWVPEERPQLVADLIRAMVA